MNHFVAFFIGVVGSIGVVHIVMWVVKPTFHRATKGHWPNSCTKCDETLDRADENV